MPKNMLVPTGAGVRKVGCNAHEAAGTFLRDLIEAERTAELDLKPLEVGAEAQIQNLEAGRHEEARQITTALSGVNL
jgi:hypothetical protein